MNLLPIVMSPLEVLFQFLPFELRRVQSRGVQLFDLYYWHEDLGDFIGEKNCREVRYDPRDISRVYVRGPDDQVKVCRCTNPGVKEISLYELREHRRRRKAAADDPVQRAARHAGIEANDALVASTIKATRAAHRKASREQERRKGAQHTAALNGISTQGEKVQEPVFDPSAPIPEFATDHIDLNTLFEGLGDTHAKH